jgi:hypothetical protein
VTASRFGFLNRPRFGDAGLTAQSESTSRLGTANAVVVSDRVFHVSAQIGVPCLWQPAEPHFPGGGLNVFGSAPGRLRRRSGRAAHRRTRRNAAVRPTTARPRRATRPGRARSSMTYLRRDGAERFASALGRLRRRNDTPLIDERGRLPRRQRRAAHRRTRRNARAQRNGRWR